MALKEDWFNLLVAAQGHRKEALALAGESYDLRKKVEVFFLEGETKKPLAIRAVRDVRLWGTFDSGTRRARNRWTGSSR